jgi:predicted aldo/keto reductase-like oxidoreductase
MRTIPQIRVRLFELAAALNVPELATLAEETKRRKPVMKTKPKHRGMTPELAEAIRQFRRANPQASQVEIARHFFVNPGRVSEVLAGFRDEDQSQNQMGFEW